MNSIRYEFGPFRCPECSRRLDYTTEDIVTCGGCSSRFHQRYVVGYWRGFNASQNITSEYLRRLKVRKDVFIVFLVLEEERSEYNSIHPTLESAKDYVASMGKELHALDIGLVAGDYYYQADILEFEYE